MSLPKFDKKNKLLAAKQVRQQGNFETVEDCGNKLYTDIRQLGIRLPEQLNISHIKNGYGDTVCFILNDLLNRELIRLNFKFEVPVIKTTEEGNDEYIMIDPDLSKYLIKMDEEGEAVVEDEVTKEVEDEKEIEGGILHSKTNEADWKKEAIRVEKELR